jgi:UV DNA damage endonuclease
MICAGLCCQNTELTKKGIRCSRTCRQANASPERIIELGRANLIDCIKMMKYNYENNIQSFRLSSEMIPHFSNPRVSRVNINEFTDLLTEIGRLSVEYNQRITFHPDQFNVLSSPDRNVIDNTYRDLEYHALMMHHMNIPESLGVINIHGGGVYGDKESAIRRWIDNFDGLTPIVKKYLTIENDERLYNTLDCLEIAEQCRIPVVFDTHHDECYRQLYDTHNLPDASELLERAYESYRKLNKVPLFHVSSQKEGARVGAHSDYINEFPIILKELAERADTPIYVDVEAKNKEQAIFDLRKRYSFIN